jgi:hypothetical protein
MELDLSSTNEQQRAIKGCDEVYSRNHFPAEPFVIGDEHVATSVGATRKLDGIGGLDCLVLAHLGVDSSAMLVESNDGNSRRPKRLFIGFDEIKPAEAFRLDQNLT